MARVAAIDNPGGMAHAKAGLCIRESTAAGSRHVTLCVTAADGVEFLYRDQTDGKTTHIFADVEALMSPLGLNTASKDRVKCRHPEEVRRS